MIDALDEMILAFGVGIRVATLKSGGVTQTRPYGFPAGPRLSRTR